MKKTLKHYLAAGALLGSASLGFAKPAQEFTKVYSFGGSFTAPNDSWAAYVTQRYGFTYSAAPLALGPGAYTADSTNFALGNRGSYELAAELANYTANVVQFNSDALYMMYVGPNDFAGSATHPLGYGNVFQADLNNGVAALLPVGAPLDAAALANYITQYQAGGVDIDVDFALTVADIAPRGTNIGNFVRDLHQGGVQYVVVFNHLNEGYRNQPLWALFGGMNADQRRLIGGISTTFFNKAIYEGIQAQAPSANVIYIDYNRLVEEVSLDAASYFTAAEIALANATYPFFLGVPGDHPHAAAHKLTGQYVASVIESPTQVALVRELPLNVGTSVAQRTRGLASSFFLSEGGSKWTIDAVGDFANSRTGSFTKKELGFKNAKTYSGEVFANYRLNAATVLGLRLNHSYTTLDFVAGKGSAKVKETALSLHGAYKFNKPFFVYGSAGFGMLNYDIERKVALGIATRKHKGSPKGKHYFATLGGGYRWVLKKSHDLALTPFVSATYQNISMDKYREGGDIQSTTMSFNMPKRQAVVAEVGATLEAKFKPKANVAILPSISTSYAYDFKNPIDDRVKGKASDMPKEFAVPAYKVEQSSIHINGQVVALTDKGLSFTVHGGVKPSSRVKSWNVGVSAGLKF